VSPREKGGGTSSSRQKGGNKGGPPQRKNRVNSKTRSFSLYEARKEKLRKKKHPYRTWLSVYGETDGREKSRKERQVARGYYPFLGPEKEKARGGPKRGTALALALKRKGERRRVETTAKQFKKGKRQKFHGVNCLNCHFSSFEGRNPEKKRKIIPEEGGI